MSQNIKDLIAKAHQTATDKGWWEKPRTFGDQVALMHSELSEALEEFRNHPDKIEEIYTYDMGPTRWGPGDKPEGIAAEFADVLIRIFDTCGHYGIPLAEAIEMKMEYNATRAHRHGGKAL